MTKQTQIVEQRTEHRETAVGEIWFALQGPGFLDFQGRLVDSSKSGFRAAHQHKSLSTGQQVRFRHSLGEGRALVMWNQILAGHVESGFLILEK